jgi:hypothetical protein
LGHYTNKYRDKTAKITLDLKSDTYPGSQIYIFVAIQLLDPIPEKGTVPASLNASRMTTTTDDSLHRGTVVGKSTINIEENRLEIRKE